MKKGADIWKTQKQSGKTAIHWVAGQGRLDMVQLLVQAAEDQGHAAADYINYQTGFAQESVMCIAASSVGASYAKEDHIDVVFNYCSFFLIQFKC